MQSSVQKGRCQDCRIASETSEASLECYYVFFLTFSGFSWAVNLSWFLSSALCRREETKACWVMELEESTNMTRHLLYASHCSRPWGHKDTQTWGGHCNLFTTPDYLVVYLFHVSALLEGEGFVKAELCLGHLCIQSRQPSSTSVGWMTEWLFTECTRWARSLSGYRDVATNNMGAVFAFGGT